jgi:hypothetical protein
MKGESDITLYRRYDDPPPGYMRRAAIVCHGGWSNKTAQGAEKSGMVMVPLRSKIVFFGPMGAKFKNKYDERLNRPDPKSPALMDTERFNLMLAGQDVNLRPIEKYTVDGRNFKITGESQYVVNYQLQGHTEEVDRRVMDCYYRGLCNEDNPYAVDLIVLDAGKNLFLGEVFSAMNQGGYDYEYWFFACRVASGLDIRG